MWAAVHFNFHFFFNFNFKCNFATRCALAGDLLLSVATKVGKSAFYRRQLFEVLVGAGLGVRCVASGIVSRSSCPCGVVSRLAGDDGIPASMAIGAGSPRLCWYWSVGGC